ncbi:Transcription elongation factor A protein-like 3 [Plecturocebus cupreus]
MNTHLPRLNQCREGGKPARQWLAHVCGRSGGLRGQEKEGNLDMEKPYNKNEGNLENEGKPEDEVEPDEEGKSDEEEKAGRGGEGRMRGQREDEREPGDEGQPQDEGSQEKQGKSEGEGKPQGEASQPPRQSQRASRGPPKSARLKIMCPGKQKEKRTGGRTIPPRTLRRTYREGI